MYNNQRFVTFFCAVKRMIDICLMKTESLIKWSIKSVSLFLLCSCLNLVYGQNEELISLEWQKEEIYRQGGKEIKVPSIAGQYLDGRIPNYYWKKRVKKGQNMSASLELISTEPATKFEVGYLRSNAIEVGEVRHELKVTNANTEKYIVLNLFPFVKVGGSIHRVTSFKIKTTPLPSSNPTVIQKDFVANSVLQPGSGFWYKISVREDGVHKIDKTFLENCGIDLETLNPQDINIYGNGEGRLPELNSVPRTDDLAKNAILVVGEADGTFDDDDYILFYGWGPHRWYENGADGFDQDRNPYSDVSCYFININSADAPLRISTQPNAVNPVTDVVTSYSYYNAHEQDLVSLVNGGQRWYGELFDAQLTRTISFNIPDIDGGSPLNIESSVASNAKTNAGTSERYSVNGNVLLDVAIPTGGGGDYGRRVREMTLTNPTSSVPIQISITRNSPDDLTYLDRLLINGRRSLRFTSTQFNFRDTSSVGIGNVAEYVLSDLPQSDGFVWEVTDRQNPRIVSGAFSGNDYIFQLNSDSLREFVASNGTDFLTPDRIGEVAYQNLHGLPQADYLIVTYRSFISQANRLADLHRANGLTVHVVTSDQVFNEFSSGALDATAIRMFAKMFYDRGASNPSTRPASLLLFGDGTFDPKNRVPNNNNYILTYQVVNSEDHIGALVTDDYFGLLDDNESISSSDLLDIGIGRLLISDLEMAKEQVDKVQHYMRNGSDLYAGESTNCNEDGVSSTFGDWRTKYVQVADDEENAYFIKNDVEPQFDTVSKYHPAMNCDKIYLDAYQQITTAGGQRYPDVNKAIDDRIERGALVINYVGHGGEVGVAEERVITVPQIQDWRNIDRLPLMVSATCEFTKYDDPDRVSAGEWASINPFGAAIALMTTTRSVFFGVNTDTGKSFFENVFRRDANNEPLSFGEIIRSTKNGVLGGGNNKRSFTLIGDPALQIALPRMNIVTDSINGIDPAIESDTIRALSKVTIKGHLEDFNGNLLSGFNGVVYPSVYDKPKEQVTLGNDPTESPIETFYIQTNRVYRGKASVVNGYFEFSFIVPKDINYSFDFGKVSYYAENGVTDALGAEQRVYVGGVDPNGINDTQGPSIELFLNDESFVNGGISDETPILIAKLFDENGINAVGNGIGHDLTAVLDGNTGDPIVLNEYYTADLDSYQSGEIRYNFSELEVGPHTLTVKVWDVNNNSSETTIEFVVKEKEQMSLEHVLNYPNPFTTYTEFFFEHNQVCNALEAQIQIFTVSGRLVRTINQLVNTEGFRSAGIPWDGRDDFGDQLAKGVYVYRVSVRSPEGTSDEKLEKLVILK